MAPQPMAPLPPRLKRRAEYLAAAKGRKAPVPGLVLQALKRPDDAPARLGFTVTRKVGNAVVLAETPVTGHDLVLIGRAGTRARRFTVLMDDLRAALLRVGASPAGRVSASPGGRVSAESSPGRVNTA